MFLSQNCWKSWKPENYFWIKENLLIDDDITYYKPISFIYENG